MNMSDAHVQILLLDPPEPMETPKKTPILITSSISKSIPNPTTRKMTIGR